MIRASVIAKRVLVDSGLLFVVNGLIIGGLRLARVIPASDGWIAPLFLVLGAAAGEPHRQAEQIALLAFDNMDSCTFN